MEEDQGARGSKRPCQAHLSYTYDMLVSARGIFSRIRRVIVVKFPDVVVNSARTHVPLATRLQAARLCKASLVFEVRDPAHPRGGSQSTNSNPPCKYRYLPLLIQLFFKRQIV